MITISIELTERFYDIMVGTIGVADPEDSPWKKWSFCYSIFELGAQEYLLDSNLAGGSKFIWKDKNKAPMVVNPRSEKARTRIQMAAETNYQFKLIYPIDTSMAALKAFAENDLRLGPEIAQARAELASILT